MLTLKYVFGFLGQKNVSKTNVKISLKFYSVNIVSSSLRYQIKALHEICALNGPICADLGGNAINCVQKSC